MPRVSVVVITYRQEDIVHETIESVLAQTMGDFELILSDDASPDGTLDVLHRYAAQDDRIRVVAAAQNGGITANCNQGLQHATGDLLCMIGGDDLMLPDRLALQAEAMDANPGAAACISSSQAFRDGTGETLATSNPIRRFGSTTFGTADILESANTLTAASAWMFRRSACPDRFEPMLPIASDVYFFLETSLAGPIIAIEPVLTRYRIREGSAVSRGLGDDPYVMRALMEARHPEFLPHIRRARGALFGFEGTRRLFDDDPMARLFFGEALRADPRNKRAWAGWLAAHLPSVVREPVLQRLRARRKRG